MTSVIYWATAIASLLGVVMNIRRQRECFLIWISTNTIWAFADFTHGLPHQAALHVVYVALAFHGYVVWKDPSDEAHPA